MEKRVMLRGVKNITKTGREGELNRSVCRIGDRKILTTDFVLLHPGVLFRVSTGEINQDLC